MSFLKKKCFEIFEKRRHSSLQFGIVKMVFMRFECKGVINNEK